jgi:hypothetical protein
MGGNHYTVLRVFVASPGDVLEERKAVGEIVEDVNVILSDHFPIKYEVAKWENAIPGMGRPQEVINRQLGIDQCNLFIGILWCRFGTPSGGTRPDNTKYDSGTQEEFELAYRSWKKKKSPHLMIFRCVKRIPPKMWDSEQMEKVKKFFSNFAADKEHPGLITEYDQTKSFEKSVRRALLHFALEKANDDDTRFPPKIRKAGFERIFTQENSDMRNQQKVQSILNTRQMFLIAHSGYSFIAHFGHRFGDAIEKKMRSNDFVFRIILTNPWSESGFFISLGEKGTDDALRLFRTSESGVKTYTNPVEVIENTRWYKVKMEDSLLGYHSLKNKYKGNLEVRFTRFEIPSSILITDNVCFYEPYLPVNLLERHEKGMLTFELMLSNQTSLYKHSKEYFDFLWEISEDIEVFEANRELYRKALECKL